MPNIFFYTIGIAFASGIFVRSFFDVGKAEILLLFVVSFSCALLWRLQAREYASPLFLVSLALLSGALGMLRLEVGESRISMFEEYVGETVLVEGVVVREPEQRERTTHLYVREDESGELLLVTIDRYKAVAYGDQIIAEGKLKVPEAFETDLGRTFNYPGYLKARGVSYAMSFAEVEIVGGREGNWLIAKLLRVKHAFMGVVEGIIPEPQAGLGEGVLLGVKRALGEDLEEAFRRVGIIHIVVLSGYNVMLVADAIARVLSLIFGLRMRVIVGILGIVTFALLVGLNPTVVRASVMGALVLIARATGRTYAILRALMLAGVVMLVVNPYLLAFDPGFQLSFLATLGLVVLAPIIERRFLLVPTKFQIREFLTATVTTQLFVLPLLLYQIGEISIVSVVVNVLVLPMVPPAMLLTFLVGSVGALIAPLGLLIGYLAYLSLGYITTIAELFSALPFATVSTPAFPFVFVLMLYAGMGYVIYRWQQYDTENEPSALDGIEGVEDADDLSDWTIETEEEKSPEALRASGESFPFR